jgi:DNA-binding response OmpR family regulator
MCQTPVENRSLVLIVDDEPTSRFLATEVLRMAGFRTEVAAGGEEALAVIPSLSPDLILLDLEMPGTDGFAVCKALRRSDSRIPVVMMSGDIDPETARKACDAGAADYITKPPDWMKLGSRLRLLLQGCGTPQRTTTEPG